MLERWHHEASINYGVANIKRLMLPLLVVETVPQEAVEEYHLKAYDTSERRRQLLFNLNYKNKLPIKRILQFLSLYFTYPHEVNIQTYGYATFILRLSFNEKGFPSSKNSMF